MAAEQDFEAENANPSRSRRKSIVDLGGGKMGWRSIISPQEHAELLGFSQEKRSSASENEGDFRSARIRDRRAGSLFVASGSWGLVFEAP